jgi:two-component system, sensor histidine kinase
VDAGKFELQDVSFSVNEIVEKVTRTHRTAVQAKHLSFASSFTATVDQVMGDPIRLCQVLSNVLSNAIKVSHTYYFATSFRRLPDLIILPPPSVVCLI